MTPEDEALQIFTETQALKTGHFILRSGLHSGHFFQCATVCQYMDKVSRLAELLIAKMGPIDCDTILAPAMGGLVIGQEVARQLNKRYVFVEKVDGKLELRRGFKFKSDEKIMIVEDVITRGGRVNEALNIVKTEGATTAAVAVIVDRSEGKASFSVPHHSLMAMSFPTYPPDALPQELAGIPAVHPGS